MADDTRALPIGRGPTPGLIGDVAALHGRYYARHWQFPVVFEAKVARELGDFLSRYDPARDLVLAIQPADRVLASLSLDGSDLALAPGEAHVRWLIVDETLQGRGIGGRLLDEAIGFARTAGFGSLYLTTFRGLDGAAALYASRGFRVTSEIEGETWGRRVAEQRLELVL